jgi:hypothetical protein
LRFKLIYLFLFVFAISRFFGQIKQFDITNGNTQAFNKQIYVYGLISKNQSAFFCIYKINAQLKTLDSLVFDLGKQSIGSYLQTYSDTLHGYLNVYLQKKEKKLVTIFRFNKKFERVATIENVNVARLNNASGFDHELFYFKNHIYTIKIQSDSGGKQFYLNKYALKSDTTNFDYQFVWQFPFERKNIHSAHIFFANKEYVLVYVGVLNGIKKGQWILKINALSGNLIRGIKLNDKYDLASYQFGNILMDSISKSIHVVGQKFTEAQFNQQENKLAISNTPFASIYLINIDSTGEVMAKNEFKIPIIEQKTVGKKVSRGFILRINSLIKEKEDKLIFDADIFSCNDNSLVYFYSNTARYIIIPIDEKLVLEKNAVTINPLIEKFYVTPDKLDMNGKLQIDTLNQFEKLFYKPLNFPVKQDFKVGTDNNPLWVLRKSNSKKNSINYSFLRLEKKIYQLSVIEDFLMNTRPQFTKLSNDVFILSNQVSNEKYQVKLFTW